MSTNIAYAFGVGIEEVADEYFRSIEDRVRAIAELAYYF